MTARDVVTTDVVTTDVAFTFGLYWSSMYEHLTWRRNRARGR